MNELLEGPCIARVEKRPLTATRDVAGDSFPRARKSRKWLRLVAQCVIAGTLLGYVVSMAPLESLASAWNQTGPLTLALACGCFVVGVLLSARRWQLLLHWQGIDEGLTRLTEVYF